MRSAWSEGTRCRASGAHVHEQRRLALTREVAMRGWAACGGPVDMLGRLDGRIDHVTLPRVSPLAAPLFLEPGKIPVHGKGRERLAQDAARSLPRAAGMD